MRYIDAEVRRAIRDVLNLPFMRLEDGTKHARLINLRTGDFLPLAGSASDFRAGRNAKAAVRRLVELGQGLIFSRTGRFPVNC